jgi:hypothetical protein
MFLSLDLPARFPVCYSFYRVLHFIDIWQRYLLSIDSIILIMWYCSLRKEIMLIKLGTLYYDDMIWVKFEW